MIDFAFTSSLNISIPHIIPPYPAHIPLSRIGENVLTYVNDQQVFEKSASDMNTVDFGPVIGQREVVRLNLIEAESCHASGRFISQMNC